MDPGEKAVRFINNLTHTKGSAAGEKFNLRKWQIDDIIRPVFGTLNPDGTRQYRIVYIEMPRKNGKSEIAAAVALFLELGDGEIGAEIYSAANDKEQAGIVYGIAAQMVRNDPVLDARLNVIDSKKRIVDYKTCSFYAAISAESYTKDGYNAHGIIYDELHAAKDRGLFDVLVTSTGARDQPLVFIITTAGSDMSTICGELHEYALRILEGSVADPTFLPIIYTVDDPELWEDEEQWHKANPALGDFRKLDEMRSAFKKAKEMPGFQNTFKRLYLNIWTEAESKWLDSEKWKACAAEFTLEDMKGRDCYIGLDLSTRIDLTCADLLFPPIEEGEPWRTIPYFYMPAENIIAREKKDRVPYTRWRDEKHITATPGEIIDYDFIFHDIVNVISKTVNVIEIGYDPWNATELALRLQKEGFEMVEIRQGVRSMGEPSKDLEAKILSKQIQHNNNPVMNYCAACVSIRTDPNGNYMPTKPDRKTAARIDGIVALIMAMARANVSEGETKSIYEERGMVTI